MDEIETEFNNIPEQEIVFKDIKRPLILACTILILIITITIGILSYFFTDQSTSKIVLWILFSIILLMGSCIILYVEYQKRQANRRKKESTLPRPSHPGWVRSMSTLEAPYIQPTPSAPKLSVASGWALNPRKWSVATTAYVVNTPQPTFGTVI